MTDYANPGAENTVVAPQSVGTSFQHGGVKGWIVATADSPTPTAQFEASAAGIDTTVIDQAFSASWSSSSFDVTIDPGEAFIAGYLARDTSTTITLPSNSTTVVDLGWDASAIDSDAVIVDTEGSTAWDPEDPRISIWEFTTDGSGVTAASRVIQPGPEYAQGITTYGRQEARDAFVTDSQLDTHRNSTSNPHDVTANQTGALPTTGGTMTGPIDTGTFGDGQVFIYLEGGTNDPILWHVGDGGSYGFQLQYHGSGTGNNNTLDLYTDNVNNSGRNRVFSITQDANLDFKATPSKNGNPLVNAGSEYEIQKNGTDGSGIINFKT